MKVLPTMNSLLRNILLITLSVGMIFYLMPTQREVQLGLREPLKTDPVYSTHVFEMELHKDTMPMPFILIWDPNWILNFGVMNWWPTCGGCIVYDSWPFPQPWSMPQNWTVNMDNNFFQVNAEQAVNDSTTQSRIDSAQMLKQSEELRMAIETIQARDSIDSDSKWKRFFKKMRRFRLFS